MIAKLTRFAALVLTVLVLLTGGLYAFAGAERILTAVQTWLSPAVLAAEGPLSAQPALPGEEDWPVLSGGVSAMAASGRRTEEGAEDAESFTHPPFALAHMLALAPAGSDQIVYILAEGSQANLWLAERQNGEWRNAMGPVYARVGRDGLRWGPLEGGDVTPSGWAGLSLYAAQDSPAARESSQLGRPRGTAGHTDAAPEPPVALELAFSGGTLLLHGSADLSAPTEGSVALSEADMARLLGLLDSRAAPMVGIFSATSAGWRIDLGVPDDFVSLAEAVPGILLEPRYAGNDNFMGRPLNGYQGYSVYLRVEAAAALAKAQAALAEQGLGLLVYDGYRPIRAVEDIFAWLASDTPGNQGDYYPELDKDDLPGIYLAENSPHRQGIAVDLTVCELETGQPLDMGTPFDFFSTRSWFNSGELSDAQRANRKLLRQTMIQAGFESYSREWWHFNYRGYVPQKTARDFVIPQ